MLQDVLNLIIKLQGINVTIKDVTDGTDYSVRAAISNYFRNPILEENIETSGRQYVISSKGLSFKPSRGDRFTISATEYYTIASVSEMVAFGQTIGYRMVLE